MSTFNTNRYLDKLEREFGSFYRQFEPFDNFLNKWRAVLDKASTEIKKPMIARMKEGGKVELTQETFQQELVFEEDNILILEWDIVYAYYDLKEREVKKEQIQIERVLPYVDVESLSFLSPDNKQPHLPLIVANTSYTLNKEMVVLNGNHRLIEARQKGMASMNGYFIDDFTHIEWMTSEQMKLMYLFLTDMRIIDDALTYQNHKTINPIKLYNKLFISRIL